MPANSRKRRPQPSSGVPSNKRVRTSAPVVSESVPVSVSQTTMHSENACTGSMTNAMASGSGSGASGDAAVLRQVQHTQDKSTQLGVAARRERMQQCTAGTSQSNPAFRASPPAEPSLLRLRTNMPSLPSASWSRIETVWNNMCWKDTVYNRDQNYLTRTRDVEPEMRSILLDWMSEVAEVYRLQRETFYLAVDIFDRFMSQTSELVPKHELQLIGVSSLFLAAKTEEIYPPKIDQFAYVTDQAFNEQQIRQAELLICKTLNWALSPVTAVQWVNTYLQIAGNLLTGNNVDTPSSMSQSHKRRLFESDHLSPPVDTMSKANYHTPTFVTVCQLLDLCLLELGWLEHSYGVLAASAVYSLATDPALALHISGYSLAELHSCIQWMSPFVQVFNMVPSALVSNVMNVHPTQTHHIHNRHMHIQHLKEVQLRQAHMTRAGCCNRENVFPTPPASDESVQAHRSRTQHLDTHMHVIQE